MPRPSNREHLLDCAEELYAAQGVGAVSLRTIQSAAGLSVGSLRYHFKTQAELVAAVVERRLAPLMARHEVLLENVASNPTPSSRDVLGAMVGPLVELLHTEPEQGRRFLALLHRLQAARQTTPLVLEQWPDVAERAGSLIQKSLPHLQRDVIEFRFDLAWDTILASLAGAADLSAPDLKRHVAALIDYLAGALEAPQSGRLRAGPKPN
jgi:AcrR family transcriptional regulator